MEKKSDFLVVFAFLFVVTFVSAASISNDLHLNIQTTSGSSITTGTFDFQFNISTLSDCSNVVYTNFTTLTTDSRGIVSYYLENVNISFSDQYWLCYYRDGVLINASKIARVPYSFRAKNVSAEGIINDSNINLRGYNLTANYIGIGIDSPSYKFEVNDATTTSMNVSNTLFVDGQNKKVGVGVSNPRDVFSISGGNLNTLISIETSAGQSGFSMNNSGVGGTTWDVWSNTATSGVGGDGDLIFFDRRNIKLKMWLKQTGLLGIAQYGGLRIGDAFFSSGGNYAFMSDNTWYNGSAWQPNLDNRESGLFGISSGVFNWYTATATAGTPSWSQKMILTIDGKLGIGTTTPLYRLEVNDNSTISMNISNTLFVDGNSSRVGIGTTTPQNSLNVIGDLNVTGQIIQEGASRMSVTHVTVQSIIDSEWMVLNYSSEEYDNLGEYDNVTDYRFTATRPGYYQVNANMLLNLDAWDIKETFKIGLFKNGVDYKRGSRWVAGATENYYPSSSLSTMVYLAEGDYIDIRAYQDSGGARNTYSASAANATNYFQVHRLS